MTSISRAEFKSQIQQTDPIRFEHFVADVWSSRGWDTQVTQEQGDRGIDIVATRGDMVSQKHLIQVKRYKKDNPVSSPDIQQYASLHQQEEDVDAVIVVTSGRFSKQARELAQKLNVKLVDSDDLYDIIEDNTPPEIINRYLDLANNAGQSSESLESTSQESRAEHSEARSGTSNSILRRDYIVWGLAIVVFGLVIIIAGSFGLFVLLDGGMEVGESTVENGLKMSVADYEFGNKISYNEAGREEVRTPGSSRAKYLLVQVRFENVGDVEKNVPDVIELQYQDKEYSGQDFRPDSNFSVDDRQRQLLPVLRPSLYPNESTEGWVVYEVPRTFEPEEATISIGAVDGPTWKIK